MTNGDNTMIYPPIKEVVRKLGEGCSRYDLVIAAAKRARAIAQKDKEDNIDDKNMVKPITRAVREIMDDDFYIVHTDENEESGCGCGILYHGCHCHVYRADSLLVVGCFTGN